MANLEPMPISSLPEGDIQDGDKMIVYRDSTGKAYQSDTGALAEAASVSQDVVELKEEVEQLSADLTDMDILGEYGESIPSGADLNDYTTPGRYNANSASIAASLTNVPATSNGFALFVLVAGATSARIQIVILGSATFSASTVNNIIFVRGHSTSSGNWTDWYGITMTK